MTQAVIMGRLQTDNYLTMSLPTLPTLATILLSSALSLSAPARAMAPKDSPWEIDFSSCVMPEYPTEAQRNEHTGRSTLEFLIRTDGSIAASLVKTSSGHGELDAAAQEALSSCRFKLRVPAAPKEEIWQLVMYVWTLEDREEPPQRQIDNSSCQRAAYPKGARDRAMTGALSLALLVRPDGSVRATRVVSSSGHPALDSATRTALSLCRVTEGGSGAVADEWIRMNYVWSESDLPTNTDVPKQTKAAKPTTQR
jgi:TonB family protein